MKSKLELKRITEKILLSKTIAEEKDAVIELFLFYNVLIESFNTSSFVSGQTIIDGGIALSPEHAKDCLEDYIRTARFIKGTYKAILKAMQIFKNEKIEIVYAGTGPLGTLIIPLLPFFSKDNIAIVFVDIHEESILNIKRIIKHLNFESYVSEFYVEDATKFKIKQGSCLHLAITETMDKALTKEPQVSITQNLAPQLTERGILVPQEIEISTRHSFYAKEKTFNSVVNYENYKNTKTKDYLFSIDKNISDIKHPFSFESNLFLKEENYENTPDICIYTRVKVFEDVYINDGESYITNPYCVSSLYAIQENEYKLIYTSKQKWLLKNAL